MDKHDLSSLIEDVAAIRAAIKKNNPLLREAAAQKGFLAFALIAALCLAVLAGIAHYLTIAFGGLAHVPPAWKNFLLLYLAFIILGGGIGKAILLSRGSKGGLRTSFLGIMASFYGGDSFHVSVPALVCIGAGCVLAVVSGHPWYCMSAIAIFFGFFSNMIGSAADLGEYHALGYYSIITGLASLAFVETAPFIWFGVIFSGMLASFALASGILRWRSERKAR